MKNEIMKEYLVPHYDMQLVNTVATNEVRVKGAV